ncbi:uncharacterized protein LOC133311324 [Gastrolobium bilobum]|uniref:uncharacterized protein LOC133311324 n=1 Tax=Gastrolobium bilobum TaxID=150636 RepID=UPI002AB0BEDC|nr:uncharacterized protein LOC133311324 [Gastrolobium bilobum]
MADDNSSIHGNNENGDGNAMIPVIEELPVMEYAIPSLDGVIPGIVQPELEANFDLKPGMVQLLQSITQYHGMPHEDPHRHITKFMKISDTFSVPGVSNEAMRMKLFPYSLGGAAEDWIEKLPSNSITTWKELGESFLMKFFPPTMVCDLRDNITGFRQCAEESLHEAWTRYKRMLRKCPTHGLPNWAIIQIFYRGLSLQGRSNLDSTAGGAFLLKKYTDAYNILEVISVNSCQWPLDRVDQPKKAAGLHEVTATTSMAAELAALNNTVKNLTKVVVDSKQPAPVQVAATTAICSLCYGPHAFEECPNNPTSVFYVGEFNRGYNNRNQYNQPRWQNQGGQYGQNQGHGYNYNAGNKAPNQSFQGGQQQFQQPKMPFPPGFSQSFPADQNKQGNAEAHPPLEQWMKDYAAKNDHAVQN